MLKTNRPDANVRTVHHFVRLFPTCALALTALTAVSVSAARAEDTAFTGAPKAVASSPQQTQMRLASADVLPASAPTIQSALTGQTLAYSALAKPEPAAARGGQLGVVNAVSPFPFALRLGAMLSPRTKFAAGVDVTIPKFALSPQLQTRVDLDAIFSANFGGLTTIVPLTFDQIYSKGLVGGTRIYVGAGVGPYFGEVTRFGGKLFVGGDFTSRVGAEAAVHFSGSGDPLVTLQMRVGL